MFYMENLSKNKNKKKLLIKRNKHYILFGKENFLLQMKTKSILKKIKKNFTLIYKFDIDLTTDWNFLIKKVENLDLFYKELIIILILPKIITEKINKNIYTIVSFAKENITLIINIFDINDINKEKFWFFKIKRNITVINCNIKNEKQFLFFIKEILIYFKINVDSDSKKFLIKNFRKNISFTIKFLKKLSVLYDKKEIKINNIKNLLDNYIIQTPKKLINEIFLKNHKQSIFILKKMKVQNLFDPIIILRNIQNNIIYLIHIKYKNKINNFYLNFFLYINKNYEKNKHLIINFSKNTSIYQLHESINLILFLEIQIKKNCKSKIVWHVFEKIILILCGFKTPKIKKK
ncbi:holA [Wigglesworthia glossinidia endosymbiont of Glossina brevipalpis]|uniref:DNA polymerase III subunit delta n=1 Tax=Wigglesworthia glossinidia brevipalpis TaxID=36870 RepID=Q8D331_WIGBR|nr:holA [Wigglesworthia glossinidia endosymbiont of Glossina brevipalpis]